MCKSLKNDFKGICLNGRLAVAGHKKDKKNPTDLRINPDDQNSSALNCKLS